MSQVTIAISVVICIAAWRRVTAPAIEYGQDTWKLVVPTGLRAIATAILAAEMGPAIAEAAPAGAPLH
jgi:hypothetical protein